MSNHCTLLSFTSSTNEEKLKTYEVQVESLEAKNNSLEETLRYVCVSVCVGVSV